jgi:UDP-N-acetylglucosamine 2-epimerase (non-hydrolysing)
MLLVSFGTRPEYIKIKSLIEEFKRNNISFKLLYTGQQPDLIQIKEQFKCLSIDDISSNRLDNIFLNIIDQIGFKINVDGITAVIVQGDTTSAFAVALSAFNRNIPVIHLEAGLRTNDMKNPYPEEFNRQAISRVASIHLCPTRSNAENLSKEGIRSPKYIVGNTGLDNIDPTPVKIDKTVLVTLHRRENWERIPDWFKALNDLATNYPHYNFIYPMHPNPDIQKYKYLLPKVFIVKPMEHAVMIRHIKSSTMVISDSGGIQEETCFLRKKLIILRKVTERPECLWLNATKCINPDYLSTAFDKMLKKELQSDYVCPYGDGRTAEKIVKILQEELKC